MPSPNTTTFTRPDLGEAFEEFPVEASQAGFVGLEVAPAFEAAEQGASFPKITGESLLEPRETLRAPTGGYTEGDYEFEEDSYATKEHGAVERIDQRLARIYAYAIDYEMVAAKRARDIVLRKFEREVATAIQSTSTFGNAAVTVPWSNPTTAQPITDVITYIDTFKSRCGYLPNVGLTSDKVMRKLKLCAEVRDLLKFSGLDDPKFPMDQFSRMLAAVLGLEKIVVGNAVYNSAKKNQALSVSNVWSDTQFGLYRVARTQDLSEACVARTMIWSGDGAGINGVFENFWDDNVRCDKIRFRHERHVKIMDSNAGYILTGVTA